MKGAVPACLTIAGSDSGGGAGLQADLKTFFALGVFGTSAVTCLTAQNPDRVDGVFPVEPDFVTAQIGTVCDGFPIAAAKTGMLYSAPIIAAVAAAAGAGRIPQLVVDPVMVATSGARLLREDAVQALCRELIPRATIVTPNLPEAEILWGREIASLDDLKAAAQGIAERFGTACVAKGGHFGEKRAGFGFRVSGENGEAEVVDVLCAGAETQVFAAPRVDAAETHGTGCTFSAALCALLARGEPLPAAVRGAQSFVARALAAAKAVGNHHPLNFMPPTARD